MSPAQLGFARTLGIIALMTILTYVGDVSHLNGVVSFGVASVISGLAMSLEHYLEATYGKPLFGAVKKVQ